MAISQDINDKQNKAFIESTDVAGQPAMAIVNPDGTAVGAPVGGATASNQTDGSQKTQIVDAGGEAATVTGGKLDVNATATLAGAALPISGATEGVAVAIVDGSGNQITSFGGGTQYTEADTDASITGTAIMFESNTGTNAISVVSNSAPLPVSDAGGALTVDGTVAVTNAALTELAAAINTDKVDVHIKSSDVATGGTSAADDADFTATTTSGTPAMGVYESTPTSVTDGDMGVAGITATRALKVQAQANSGVDIGDVTINNATIAVTQSGTWDEVGINDSGNSITVDGTVTADLGATDNAVLDAIAASTAAIETAVEGTLTVTGGGGGVEYTEGDTDATITGSVAMMEVGGDAVQPIQGTVAGGLLVNLGSNNDVTVTGTVDLGATDNAVLDTIDAVLDTINAKLVTGTDIGDVTINNSTGAAAVNIQDGGNSITVDGSLTVDLGANNDVTVTSGAITETNSSAIKTAVELADDTVYVDDADWTDSTSKHALVGGLYQSTPQTVTDGDVAPFNITANGALHVSDAGGSLTVDGTVTANLSATDNTVLDNIDADLTTVIGHVDGIETVLGTIDTDTSNMATSLGNLDNSVDGNYLNVNANIAGTDMVSGSGTATGALRVELPTNGTGVIATVGAVTAITNALPAGTNAIGKLASNSGVDIGDVTLTAGTAAIGTVLPPDTDVTTHTNYARKYYTSAGAATDGIIWSPAAGKRWHVVTMYINVSAAATVTLEDDKAGGDDPVWKGEIAANSGVVLQFPEHYPMASGEDAADLTITTSAGKVYVTCVGYEI